MVSVTLEGLWMFSDRVVDFPFFFTFRRSGPAIIFNSWTLYEHVSYESIKAPHQAKDLVNMVCVTVEGLWMVSVRIVDFRFFVKFHSSGPAIIFNLWTLKKHVSYASQKLLINMMCVTVEGFLIELFIFSFWIVKEHVSYASKKLLIKQKT